MAALIEDVSNANCSSFLHRLFASTRGASNGALASRASHHHPAVAPRLRAGLQPSQPALLQRDGLGRVFALLRAALAGEVLALDVPEAVAVVEPADRQAAGQRTASRRDGPKRRGAPHPSSCPLRMSRELKKAMRGKRRSWCSMKTRTGMRFGSHRWLMKRLMLP